MSCAEITQRDLAKETNKRRIAQEKSLTKTDIQRKRDIQKETCAGRRETWKGDLAQEADVEEET